MLPETADSFFPKPPAMLFKPWVLHFHLAQLGPWTCCKPSCASNTPSLSPGGGARRLASTGLLPVAPPNQIWWAFCLASSRQWWYLPLAPLSPLGHPPPFLGLPFLAFLFNYVILVGLSCLGPDVVSLGDYILEAWVIGERS